MTVRRFVGMGLLFSVQAGARSQGLRHRLASGLTGT
jgi:hypothetical protein